MLRYPHIVEDVIEEEEQTVNGVDIPIDTSQPNSNGTEFDNLYLVCDACVSGLQHPCFLAVNVFEHLHDRAAYSDRVLAYRI